MNEWTAKSVEIANSAGYLDRLSEIYQINPNPERQIPPEALPIIKELHEKKNAPGLVKKLIELKKLKELKKFPIDDPYVGCLSYSDIFSKNPKTVERIGNRLLEFDYNALITLCKQPKSGTRQLGHMFKHWIKKLGFPSFNEADFNRSEKICLLDGSDKSLMEHVNSRLGGSLDKGIDLVLKVKPNNFVIGEVKFITASGGTQTNQLNVALNLTNESIAKTASIAIVDGAVWFNNSYRKKVTEKEKPIMSALLLKDYIESLI